MSENHDEISRNLGRLEGKIDGILEQNKAQFDLLYKHQVNLNELNIWRAGITGKVSMITVFIGGLMGILMAFIKEIWSWLKG